MMVAIPDLPGLWQNQTELTTCQLGKLSWTGEVLHHPLSGEVVFCIAWSFFNGFEKYDKEGRRLFHFTLISGLKLAFMALMMVSIHVLKPLQIIHSFI